MANDKENILPGRDSVISAFQEIDRLQVEAEKIIVGVPYADYEATPKNKWRILLTPGASDPFLKAGNRVNEIRVIHNEIMKKYIFPHIYADIRNKPKFDAALDKVMGNLSLTKIVSAQREYINDLKEILRI